MGPRVGMYMIEPENTIHISKDTYGHRTKILCLVVESQSLITQQACWESHCWCGRDEQALGVAEFPVIYLQFVVYLPLKFHHTHTADWHSGQRLTSCISHLQMATHSTLGIKCATKPGLNSSGLVWTFGGLEVGGEAMGSQPPICELSRLWGAAPCDPQPALAGLETERE